MKEGTDWRFLNELKQEPKGALRLPSRVRCGLTCVARVLLEPQVGLYENASHLRSVDRMGRLGLGARCHESGQGRGGDLKDHPVFPGAYISMQEVA